MPAEIEGGRGRDFGLFQRRAKNPAVCRGALCRAGERGTDCRRAGDVRRTFKPYVQGGDGDFPEKIYQQGAG